MELSLDKDGKMNGDVGENSASEEYDRSTKPVCGCGRHCDPELDDQLEHDAQDAVASKDISSS